MKEKFLFCKAIDCGDGKTIQKTLVDYLSDNGIPLSNCVAVTTDGAASMIGEKKRFFDKFGERNSGNES